MSRISPFDEATGVADFVKHSIASSDFVQLRGCKMISSVLQKLEDLQGNLAKVDPGDESHAADAVEAMIAALRGVMEAARPASATQAMRLFARPDAPIRSVVN